MINPESRSSGMSQYEGIESLHVCVSCCRLACYSYRAWPSNDAIEIEMKQNGTQLYISWGTYVCVRMFDDVQERTCETILSCGFSIETRAIRTHTLTYWQRQPLSCIDSDRRDTHFSQQKRNQPNLRVLPCCCCSWWWWWRRVVISVDDDNNLQKPQHSRRRRTTTTTTQTMNSLLVHAVRTTKGTRRFTIRITN